MQLSLAPLLLMAELGFLLALVRRGSLGGSVRAAVHAYWLWLVAYAVGTTVLGASDAYVDERMLRSLPALWLQGITVAAFVAPVVLFDRVRTGVRQIADSTPWHWLAYFHALRIAALGTAYKTWIGEFPAYFELLVGVPDLLFGISALWMGSRVRRGSIGARGFYCWNLVGGLIIVPSAPVLLQLGLPGPIQVFGGLPDARAVFTYPMSIAPMMGVPIFVMVNLGVAWRLWERGSLKRPVGG